MFRRTKNNFVGIMATGLAFLGVLRALTIDNQLTVIKNGKKKIIISKKIVPVKIRPIIGKNKLCSTYKS